MHVKRSHFRYCNCTKGRWHQSTIESSINFLHEIINCTELYRIINCFFTIASNRSQVRVAKFAVRLELKDLP